MTGCALYHGVVTHHRTRPVLQSWRYRVFMLLLDLDEVGAIARKLRLFRYDRSGLLSFFQRDHGDGSATGLRAWLDAHLLAAGLPTGGAVRVLCMPRVLGHAFNPLALFFCHAPNGALQAMLYEVSNTFGQRHSYLLPVQNATLPVRQHCNKAFFVSPFMDMDLHYSFRVLPPGPRAGVVITASDNDGTILSASFTGRRGAFTDAALAAAVLRMPLQGAKTLFFIHWEALKLWLKGLKLRRPAALPRRAVTIIQ